MTALRSVHFMTTLCSVYYVKLTNSKIVDNPLELNTKLWGIDGELLPDATFYKQLVVCLIYLSVIQPDLALCGSLSQFMTALCSVHFMTVLHSVYFMTTLHSVHYVAALGSSAM
jgi:hypothetical protein